MKNVFFIFLLSHLFIYSLAQDLIIIIELRTDTIKCNIKSYNESAIAYKTSENPELQFIDVNDINRCDFHEEGDEIIFNVIVFDTLSCRITSIDNDSVYFQSTDKIILNKSIGKSDIFSCHFGEKIAQNKIYAYRERFQLVYMDNSKQSINNLVRKNGEIINAKLLSINDEKIDIEILINDKKRNSFIKRNDVSSFIFNNYDKKLFLKQKSDYILTEEGRLIACQIKSIDEEKINIMVPTATYDVYFSSYYNKSKINSVLFNNYESDKGIQAKKVKDKRNFEFNGKAGVGHMFAGLNKDVPDQLLDYSNELRTGFNFDLNINVYLSYYSGIGLTYKYFRTSNKISDISINKYGNTITKFEDNISIAFFGPNYIYSTSPEKSLVYDLSVSPGLLTYKNKAKYNSTPIKINGLGYAANISNRLCFYNPKGSGIFLDFSILIGFINQYSIEDQTVKPESADNVSRFEFGIGFKFN